MINKINKKLFILLILTLLLVGIASATEISADTTTHNTQPSTDTMNIKEQSITKNMETQIKQDNKEIKKQNTLNKTTKKASKTINVNNYQTLYDTLTSDEYETLTLNIKSNIKLTEDTIINDKITKLTINGNDKTISGNKKYQFLNIPSRTTATIKNLNIINCYSLEGGAISNTGKLTITKCNLNNNKAESSGGSIHNSATLIIKDSKLHNNKAKYGAAIINYGKLTITNTKLYSNTATDGGAIDNEETMTISNSQINNNKAQNGGALYNIGTLTIKGTNFNNNKANKYGGAIIEKTYDTNRNIKISAKFTNNTAPRG
ncbi:hypothetical protein PXD04_11605 (plasmid) [Methanosphaera sp. ISO3-F5]|uniref:hypothetical protein n=1 Tax=Methanosphaera sp. ISO3-F5 TaxID=1452353 RepID=UPI002B25CB6E|nr:hypothetical protein [Methanosphaera sp. ISO3-F5]WQH65386.1 hypothetical protein PXD04_11605 [Methanosphaera sp. ISO3-F5]